MEKVEIKLSQFGLEDSEKRRYFVRKDGKVEVLKIKHNGMEKTMIKVTPLNNGYPVIWVVKDSKGNRTAIYVREMVATAFLGYDKNNDSQKLINIDFDKTNNKLENVKVVTPEEWKNHYKSTFQKMKGVDRSQNPPNNKLTLSQVKKIKALLKDSKDIPKVAEKFKISIGQVYRIKRGENWSKI
ncbi:HNH endonuclease [Chishuiella sp.]|uniref:HNH endonuclease n=1 Tax=Chishuiella sp. TaxID=1969467 RepID=UPI0028AC26D4|nr:HNH endonuclease [Chishuiella sp.]